jgi:hypothetical protein
MPNVDWRIYKKCLVPAVNVAPHNAVNISHKEARLLLKQNKEAWMIRWTSEFDCVENTKFWYLVKDSMTYNGFEELNSTARNHIRKSLKTCDFKQMSKSEYIAEAYDVYKSAFERYKVPDGSAISKEAWVSQLQNIDNQNIDIWGGYDKESGILIAYAFNIIQDNHCSISVLKGIPQYMKRPHLSFYGLIHIMNEHYFNEKQFCYVCAGARSLTEHSNIQDTLIQTFKFRKAYCKLHVEYVWWLKIIIKLLFPLRNLIKNVRIKGVLKMEEYKYRK